jgi:ribonuclease G
MSREILVNITPRESRAALIDQSVVQEIYVERANRRGIVGNLYRGQVSRVLPGMQAAFLEIGLERTAFLHAADIAGPVAGAAAPAISASADAPRQQAGISQLLTQGDELLVQVLKDPLGTKGARLTTLISLPSRFLVYMPHSTGVGISARIEGDAERTRLRDLVRNLGGISDTDRGTGGYIVRTAAAGAPLEALAADMMFLARLWQHIQQRSRLPAGSLVHEELPLSLRVLRDEMNPDVARVLVDSRLEFERMRSFAAAFMPDAVDRIELHDGVRPIFDLYTVEEELGRALERKVNLKSGGHIVIDQTESMTTIDVNTGAYVGHSSQEETSFRTNLEAAATVARQLRLRNLGGIIIIDFIDMEDDSHRQQLMAALRAALAGDRAQTHIAGVSELGLVEMTRKRTRESLEHLLCEICPACEGRRFVKSVETICHDIYREALRQSRQYTIKELVILANPEVVERLLDGEAQVLADLEAQVGKPVRLQSEALYPIEQYDVVLA